MAAETRVTKKKKVSKKSKRSWRKYTNLKDVEEHLEEVRREERTGGPVSEKPDAKLFFVDTESKETPNDGVKQIKRSRKRKLLKSDQLLLPDSRIKPVGSKKRKLNKSKQGKGKGMLIDSDSSADEEEEHALFNAKARKHGEKQEKTTAFDLWATKEKLEGDEHYLKVMRKKKIKVPKTAQRQVTELPAIEVCQPGASYNPAFEDHQDLLLNANEVEVTKLKANEKLDRQIKFLSKEEADALPTWEEEMSQGLFDNKDNDDESGDDDEEEDEEEVSVCPASVGNRKTRHQRNKAAEDKQMQRELETEKELKLKENEVYRIKSLKKEIHLAEMEAEKRKKKKEEKQKGHLQKTGKLGRHTYAKPHMEIQLSDEITGNLRSLKQEGNLFTDRFRSLQRRNIIEPRVPVIPHRRYALKEYKKRSYKKLCIKEI